MFSIIWQGPYFPTKKFQSRQIPPLEQIFFILWWHACFWGLQPFWEYWKGGGSRRGVKYIIRIFPKITPTTNKNYKSLSHTILDILCLFHEVMRAMQTEFWPTIWPVRILPRNCLESHRIIENIILTQKSWNLKKKKIVHPFGWNVPTVLYNFTLLRFETLISILTGQQSMENFVLCTPTNTRWN